MATLQKWLSRIGPSLVALCLAAALVLRPGMAFSSDIYWVGVPLCVAVAYLVPRARLRFAEVGGGTPLRAEVEAALFLAVIAYACVELVPGQTASSARPLVYLQMMLTAGFLAPRAVASAFALSVALELGLGWYKHGASPTSIVVRTLLLATFASVNLLTVRGEIARVRRLSRERVDSELSRLREAARTYRLSGAPRSALDTAAAGAEAPNGDPERLLHSSVEHLELSLRYVLYLLRGALGLRTAALVWLAPDRKSVHLREASSCMPELNPGPFTTFEGIFAACLKGGGPAVLEGARSQDCFPLYPAEQAPTDGKVCAVPVVENQEIVGALLVHTSRDASLDSEALQLLMDAAQFAQRSVRNERLLVSLEQAKTDQGKLYYAVDQLSEARTEAEVIEAGVKSARQFTAFDFAAVTVFHPESRSHEICAVSGPASETLVGKSFAHNRGLVGMVVENGHALPYRGIFNAPHQVAFSSDLPAPDMPSLIVLPLFFHETALGTLLLGSETAHAFGEELRPTLEVLARHIAVSLANARMLKRLEELATTDGLTGLLNKRALIEVARHKVKSSARFKKPLSVLIGDIDHFKKVNDTHGHDVGDVVIRGFGDVLRRSKRETDAVGRFGGEEFVVVCEETDEDGAQLLAERIRQELEATRFHAAEGTVSVTCSIGIATFPRAGQDWESLFKATDEALYASKRGGRNRVTVWKPSLRGAA